MSSVIKGVTSAIVYSPLVLLCFTVVFIIGYGIYHYKQESTLPDSGAKPPLTIETFA